MGIYLSRVLDTGAVTVLTPLIGPLERLFYRLFGINNGEERPGGITVLASYIQLYIFDLQLHYPALPVSAP